MRNKIGVNPDELRERLKRQAEQLETIERDAVVAAALDAAALAALDARVVVLETATPTGWTDAQPRWVAYPVTYTGFTGAALSVTITIATLPAGASWTAVWVKPGTLFASPTVPIWQLNVDVPATGATASGAPKTVDVTTPDALAQQAASWYVQCDTSGTATVTATLANGTDNANTLTAGTATIYLLLSIPGATTDALPHA